MKYTVRDLNERAIHTVKGMDELYEIDGHKIALISVWAYSGGINGHHVSVHVDGNIIATRCKRETAVRKALQVLNEQ